MRRWMWVLGLGVFALGASCLALTLYLWFGAWPQGLKRSIDYYRSVAAAEGAPPAPPIANVRARRVQSLNGPWRSLVDPIPLGDVPVLGDVIPRDLRAEDPSELVELSFEDAPVLQVPGDWNTQDERLFFYTGSVWYQRSFAYQPEPGRRLFLWFGAANYRASVTLNDRRVGGHEGGFTPFALEVTDAVREGENRVVVRVDNRLTPEDVPVPLHDWLNYGGLTRDVMLVDVPRTFIREYAVHLDPDGGERVVGWVQLDGPDPSQEVSVSIPELGVETVVTTGGDGRTDFEIAASPQRWSPAMPRLYRVELRSESDSIVEEIGFRTIEVSGREILLNGEPVFLRGISLHEERLSPEGGRAFSLEHDEQLVAIARELGANFLRLAHYPHNEHMLRLADRQGLLVWSEIPVYQDIAFEEPRTLERARTQLSEMIARDRNRASIILWSIGNETLVSDARNAFMEALAEQARRDDPTRPITAALLAGPADLARWALGDVLPAAAGLPSDPWVYRVSDPLGKIVDVAALNEYFGWYYSTPIAAATPLTALEARRLVLTHLPRLRIETGLDKPLIVSEFGAGALAGRHAAEEELAVFSEEYQARVYREQLEMLGHQPDLRGLSPWVLKDFRSPIRMLPGVQDYWNRKGLVSPTGQRKLAFDVLRQHYEQGAGAASGAAP